MAVIAICPKCKARLKASEELLGKTVKCPGCTTPVTVRASSATPLPATIKPTASPVRPSAPLAPVRPPQVLDELPEVDDEEEEVADVLAVEEEDEVVDVDEIEEIEDVEEADTRIAPSRRSSLRRRDDDYDDDEDRERSKKRKKASRDRDRRDNEKMLAMLLHLSSFLVGFLGPLVIWLVKKDDSRFIDHHGRNHLNYQVTLFVWFAGIMVIGFSVGCLLGIVVPFLAFILGLLTWLALAGLGVYSTVMVIIAAVNAKNGVWYELPATIAPFGHVRDSMRPY